MGMSTLSTLGLKALEANYAALTVTGQNIANVNTEGYSRQQVELANTPGQQTGMGFFGRGVDVTTVTRSYDALISRQALTSASLAAADGTRSEWLTSLESVFGMGEEGIGFSASQFFDSMVDMVNIPADSSARQVVLSSAEELAARIRSTAEQLQGMQLGINVEIKAAVESINSYAKQIASLNVAISAAQGAGHTPNDLLDQRDRVLGQLGEMVQFTTIQAEDGSIGVFIGGGQQLVLGATAQNLVTTLDPFDSSVMTVALRDASGTRILPSSLIQGGSLYGLMRFQEDDLQAARQRLGQLATSVAVAVNDQQALGYTLGQPPVFGGPLFELGSPKVLPSSYNAQVAGVPVASYVDGLGNRVPSVSLAVVDSTQVLADQYELFADPSLPAGSYRLTRASDGLVRTVSNGSVMDGIQITIAAPPPAAGDRFQLQTVSAVALDMRVALSDPRGIAAASPVSGVLGAANTGTMSVRSVTALNPSINPDLTATITFGAGGSYNWTLVDTTATLPTTSGSGTWSPGQSITLNQFELKLDGMPQAGDTVTVEETRFPAGNNGNARALLQLRDLGMVGERDLGAGNILPGMTMTDAFASLITDLGVRSHTAQAIQAQSAAVAQRHRESRQSVAGVNLDEEAARLIQFQQAYQAAAKMLQVAQSVFDTLLETTR